MEKRTSGTTQVESNRFGLNEHNVIGWLSNIHNPALGWSIHRLTPSEEAEFGCENVYRSYSCRTDSTNIIKIENGKYAFLNSEAYGNGIVKFERAAKYLRFMVD